MSEPGNPENERLSDIAPWEKIERCAGRMQLLDDAEHDGNVPVSGITNCSCTERGCRYT